MQQPPFHSLIDLQFLCVSLGSDPTLAGSNLASHEDLMSNPAGLILFPLEHKRVSAPNRIEVTATSCLKALLLIVTGTPSPHTYPIQHGPRAVRMRSSPATRNPEGGHFGQLGHAGEKSVTCLVSFFVVFLWWGNTLD